jgi:hypothetical protein
MESAVTREFANPQSPIRQAPIRQSAIADLQ